MKKLFFTSLLVVATVGLIFTGCKKDQPDEETDSATDNALSEGTYSDVKNIADEAQDKNGIVNYRFAGSNAILSACATVTYDTTVTPRVVTIDFGTTGCLCKDQKTRKGKIIITYTGQFKDSGKVVTVSFSNYFVQGNRVEGSKTWTNKGRIGGFITYDIVVDGRITKADGTVITWASTRRWQWTKGESTMGRIDDEYTILAGSTSEGTHKNGGHYKATVTKDLVRRVSCHQFVSGVVEFTPDSKPTRTIDFGNGDCDDIATVSVNGHSKTINLR
jgi:hypothetical protein